MGGKIWNFLKAKEILTNRITNGIRSRNETEYSDFLSKQTFK